MKLYLLTFGLIAGFVLANAAVPGGGCSLSSDSCTSLFSGFPHVQSDLNKYTKQMLDKSFDFLLLSSVFDAYTLDRPGFEKLYRKISDKAWEDTIELIKYQSRRGASITLNKGNENSAAVRDVESLLQSNETSSLKLAIHYEKIMATEAHHIHKKISHAETGKHYDPDVAHYLDEKLIEYQSGTIRKLSGYITNLNDILNEASTKDLGVHLFDDYLDKVE
ncbi:soma ferritin-like [Wyeomyia smithii]|uniref:soma ferritin-like n=1 Tax=Wyeomyia smithii TaxID=174621 RepID=UPI002467EA5A|nr:soma ferritin-like [Wyeomyia smithii]XP_055533887.1 soma ferritin-like [Wyeomyia smithii]XP_055533895.1 soma ferritin-like [Wyeomyia smithii]